MTVRPRPLIEDQSRNGVRVLVHRFPDGTTYVDAACKCFGHLGRAHSDEACPVLRGRKRGG